MKTELFNLPLGDEDARLKITAWGQSTSVHINLHENEQTSVEAAYEVLSKTGGTLIELQSKGERLITFKQGPKTYLFDPNRIFSRKGIQDTLKEYSICDRVSENAITGFADQLVKRTISFSPEYIVALHNTSDEFTIESYKKDKVYSDDYSDIYINPQHHRADFFLTTEKSAFETLKKTRFNVVLQNNETARDDGSLSIYCGSKGIKYINIEALHGHKKEQKEMLKFVNDTFFNPTA